MAPIQVFSLSYAGYKLTFNYENGWYLGKALMSIKASFSNVANVLLDWDDVHNDDFCSWRGVFCDNASLSVLTLYASLL